MESGLRLYDMEDIIAMKFAAISDDGSQLKDFIDMAFLSTRFSLDSMLRCFERKFLFRWAVKASYISMTSTSGEGLHSLTNIPGRISR